MPTGEWTLEEDVALESLYREYGSNWILVTGALNARIPGQRRGHSVERGPWDAYRRVLHLVENPLMSSGAIASTPTSATPTGTTLPDVSNLDLIARRRRQKARLSSEREKRREKLMTTFEYICKAAKKRDNVRHPPGIYLTLSNLPFFPYSMAAKKLNLSVHETHLASQASAGVQIGAPPLTPIQVSRLKERRDAELRALAEQRKLYEAGMRAAAQQAGGAPPNMPGHPRPPGGSPARPPIHGRVPHPGATQQHNEQLKQFIQRNVVYPAPARVR